MEKVIGSFLRLASDAGAANSKRLLSAGAHEEEGPRDRDLAERTKGEEGLAA